MNKIKILEDKVNGLKNEVKQPKLITEKLYKKVKNYIGLNSVKRKKPKISTMVISMKTIV